MIDLFSDTATQPTAGMWDAMRHAPLGDEQRRNDPTVNRLEQRVAELLGQESALLMPSATMANQVALTVHCDHGSEVLCHESSHVYHFEGGGMATNARAQAVALRGDNGMFDAETLLAALRPDDPHYPRSRVVVVENTCNLAGGTVWKEEPFKKVVRTCREHGLRLHMDGARLFNAAVAANCTVDFWSARADSVQVCFSKGLGCPFGAILAGSAQFVEQARRVKQTFGGALRQAGVIASAMLYALDNHVNLLKLDHERLARLAGALQLLEGMTLSAHETNILYFSHTTKSAEESRQALAKHGICVSQVGKRLRVCTHLGVGDAEIDMAIEGFRSVFGESRAE